MARTNEEFFSALNEAVGKLREVGAEAAARALGEASVVHTIPMSEFFGALTLTLEKPDVKEAFRRAGETQRYQRLLKASRKAGGFTRF